MIDRRAAQGDGTAGAPKPPAGTKDNPKPPMPHPLPGPYAPGGIPTRLCALAARPSEKPDQEQDQEADRGPEPMSNEATKDLTAPAPPPSLAPVRPAPPPGVDPIEDHAREQAILLLQAHIAEFKAKLAAFSCALEGEFGAYVQKLKEHV